MRESASIPSPATLISLGLLALVLVALAALLPYAAGYADFRRTIYTIASENWFNTSDTTWQHGVIAPLIAGWLGWRKRHTLSAMPLRPSWAGLALVLFAMLLYFTGYRANNNYLGYGAMQLFPMGAVVWLFGWRQARSLGICWVMLAFTWPLLFLTDTLGFSLRLIMVKGVAALLELFHAPILRDGTTFLSAPDGTHPAGAWLTLNVEGACSGMRSLFALMMISTLYAWFREKTLWRRIIVCAASIPLAIAGNMVRIFLLIGASALFGQSFAVGDEQVETSSFHFVAGVAVFIIAAAGLLGLSRMLSLLDHTKPGSSAAIPAAS